MMKTAWIEGLGDGSFVVRTSHNPKGYVYRTGGPYSLPEHYGRGPFDRACAYLRALRIQYGFQIIA